MICDKLELKNAQNGKFFSQFAKTNSREIFQTAQFAKIDSLEKKNSFEFAKINSREM